jgi:hypothetical protein
MLHVQMYSRIVRFATKETRCRRAGLATASRMV